MRDPLNLNVRHIDAAVAVGRTGSISAAAKAVHLSQPALTQALAKLEAAIGQRLFDRHNAGARPTAAGELFFARAASALFHIAEASRAVRRAARLPAMGHPERRLSMTQLRAFSEVVRAGSYARAARDNGLSQPSIHRAARELELIHGVPLLVRIGSGVQATAAGQRLARGVRLAVSELSAGLDELDALAGTGAGRLRIGTLPLPRAGLLPEALAAFAADHPRARISVIEGPYADLLPALRSGDIDLLLGALRADEQDTGIVQRSLFEDDLFIVARARHPLATGTPSPAALADYPWVVAAPGAPMRTTWEGIFADGRHPSVRIECGSVLATRGLLLAGDWLALMSPDQFRIEEDAGVLSRIGPPVPGSRRAIGIAFRADWRPTAVQADFVAALDQAAARRT